MLQYFQFSVFSFNFKSWNARFEESWRPKWLEPKVRLVQPKTFWAKAENTQNIIELWRSIKQKVHARSKLSVGLFLQLPNYPSHFTENLTLPFDLGQTIFLSNISKLKHNQMQTQKHNLKINQTTIIKAKKFLLS